MSCTCTTRNAQSRRRALCVAIAVALALLLPQPVSAVASTSVAATSPTSASTTTATAAKKCSKIVLQGKVKRRDGSRLKRFGVAVNRHEAAKRLALTRTNKKGWFRLKVCRSKRLGRYARKHNGRVNFDVVAHHWKKRRAPLWVRVVSPKYGKNKVRAGGKFTPARSLRPTSGKSSASSVSARVLPGQADFDAATIYPAVVFMQAVRGMTAHYQVSSSSLRTTQAKVAVSNSSYGGAGTLSLNNSSGFSANGKLKSTKKKRKRARLIRPELMVQSKWNCIHYPTAWSLLLDDKVCFSAYSGEWTGIIKHSGARFSSCHAGGAPVDILNNRKDKSRSVSRGVVFSSEVGGSSPVGSLSFITEYGSGTKVRYALKQRTKRKRKFCLGGNASTIAKSSRLYINRIPRKSGGGGCRRTLQAPQC